MTPWHPYLLTLAGSLLLMLGGCGDSHQPEDPIRVGLVTDIGGIADQSFNASALEGLERAIGELGIMGWYRESRQAADYLVNIQFFLDRDFDLIVTVGYLMGVDTALAAQANPSTHFAIVDHAYPDCLTADDRPGVTCGATTELPNVLGLTFAVEQASFLAGYAAAATSVSGTVGTFGALDIPPVTQFMAGFTAGVDYYNDQTGAAVAVLGWDPESGAGLFTGNFTIEADGYAFAQDLVAAGADVILPVAGRQGHGSAAYCQETQRCLVIGVDNDWTLSASAYAEVILTSILKRTDLAVFDAIQGEVAGRFADGRYLGTLANGGVGIASVRGASAELRAELAAIATAIADGTLVVGG